MRRSTNNNAVLAINEDLDVASQHLQHHLTQLQDWPKNLRVRVDQAKSAQITFKNRRVNCHMITINGTQLPDFTKVK